MKLSLVDYEFSPLLTLFVVPETDEERVLLRSLWRFGTLKMCNGVADGTGLGFAITTKENAEEVCEP